MTSAPTTTTRLRRGAGKRCAVCGGGNLFRGYYELKDTCPACGVRFSREEGFFTGAVFVSFAITEIVMFAFIAVVLLATMPEPDVPTLIVGSVAISGVVPLVIYPFSKTLWFAIHLAMEPLAPEEEAAAAVVRFERGDGASS